MASKEKKNQEADKDDAAKPAEVKIGIVTWAIMLTIVAVLSGSGFFLGRLLAHSAPGPETTESQEDEKSPSPPPPSTPGSANASEGTWYYNDLKPVVVNPNEPGATRFVRVDLILEVSNELTPEKATETILAKTPLLINWINLYLKSLSLSQMENEKDMKRILSQICDGFNEILFFESKPQIKNVLIREFNIQ
jgi:flagellar basal body-associated protein FliL